MVMVRLRRCAGCGGGGRGDARDRPRVGGVDRCGGLGLGGLDAGRRVVLEVRQGGMVRVGGEPAVDERLDRARPALGAADEVAPALGLEVGDGLRVALVARAGELHLGLDLGVGDVDPLGVRDLGQHEQHLDPLLGARPELGVEVGLGLLGGLEVRGLRDALARERRPELVVHHLDLLVDQDVGEVDGRVGDGVLDDPVAELVARAVERVAAQPLADVCPQRRQVRVVPHRLRERVVGVGEDLLAQLLEVDREVHLLAGQRLLRVVVGERDVEVGRLARLEADEVCLEPRDQPVLADDQRHPLGRAAVERRAVLRAGEADHRPVAVLRPAVLDGGEGGVLVAQLVDDVVDLRRRRRPRSRART